MATQYFNFLKYIFYIKYIFSLKRKAVHVLRKGNKVHKPKHSKQIYPTFRDYFPQAINSTYFLNSKLLKSSLYETVFQIQPTSLKSETLLIPLLANSHIFQISEEVLPYSHDTTLDFANAFLFPGVNIASFPRCISASYSISRLINIFPVQYIEYYLF